MSLLDRKIPILTGINDVPSTTGQPKHPNASLLCKQYNDLIDNELTALETALANATTLDYVQLYRYLIYNNIPTYNWYYVKNLVNNSIYLMGFYGNVFENLAYRKPNNIANEDWSDLAMTITYVGYGTIYHDGTVDNGGGEVVLSSVNNFDWGTITITPTGDISVSLAPETTFAQLSIYYNTAEVTFVSGVMKLNLIVIPDVMTIEVGSSGGGGGGSG